MEDKIYWCDSCKIPLFEDKCSLCGGVGVVVGKDIRPVFPEEKLLLEILLEMDLGSLDKVSVGCILRVFFEEKSRV